MTRAIEKAKKPIDVESIFKAAADEARKADADAENAKNAKNVSVKAMHDEATVTTPKKKKTSY